MGTLIVVGLNHKTAPVAVLERAAVPGELVGKALNALCACRHVAEAVVVSTCNRVEVYAAVTRYHGGVADLRRFFCDWGRFTPEELTHSLYDYHDEAAARHLFAVTSGLDSMLVGEQQVHLQVKQALLDASAHHACGRRLQPLCEHALRVGKRTRKETTIASGSHSIVDIGVDAASRHFGDLHDRTALIIGAGRTGGLAARRLAGRVRRLLVANRGRDSRERLAARVDATPLPLDDLADALATVDLAVCATESPYPVVDADHLTAAMARRHGRPLVLADLAVPRDVDPTCARIAGVTLVDLDRIREAVDRDHAATDLARAWAIVEEETEAFAAARRTLQVQPTIAALHRRGEQIRQGELDRVAGKLTGLAPEQRQAVEALTRRIVNTLLHDPTVRLKQAAQHHPDDAVLADAAHALFDLPQGAGDRTRQ